MQDKVDVLIIGSGASGAAVAWSLADTKMRILCLEQGDWVKPTDYPSNGRDWEARLFSDFAINPNRRARETDYPINDANSPIKVVNFNGVGGSTIMYTAHYPRLQPSDFQVRTLDGVADDWPVDYDTLEPFFAENDRMMGVSGLAGDPAYPFHQPPMPPLPLGKIGHALRQGDEQARLALVAVRFDDRHHRVRRPRRLHQSRPLHAGLRAGRQGQHRHHLLAARDPRRRRAAHARPGARDHVDEHGMASGAIYYDAEGVEHFQPAEMVIVACNGVGTPRLLLNSQSGRFPNGLANSSGLVGKNLMFHPYRHTYGYVDEPIDGNQGPPLCLWSQEFYETDQARDFVRGYTLPVRPRRRPRSWRRSPARRRGRLPWGEDHHRVYRQLLNHRIGLSAIIEDLPEEHNRVTLDPVLKDSNGIPAPRIDYTIGEQQPEDDGARHRATRRRSSTRPARRTSAPRRRS